MGWRTSRGEGKGLYRVKHREQKDQLAEIQRDAAIGGHSETGKTQAYMHRWRWPGMEEF